VIQEAVHPVRGIVGGLLEIGKSPGEAGRVRQSSLQAVQLLPRAPPRNPECNRAYSAEFRGCEE
jgi:hypothetical protein